jgi:hypothetical protein
MTYFAVLNQKLYPGAGDHLALVTDSLGRFWRKVDVPFTPGSCWTWTAGRNGDGYGTFQLTLAPHRYAAVGAHRLAYMALVGPIPEGTEIDHLCRNRLCVRPDHLEAVPHRVNILRGDGAAARAARRTHHKCGRPYETLVEPWGRLRRVCRPCANERERRHAETEHGKALARARCQRYRAKKRAERAA